jgi:hypothetical protein
MRQFSAYLAACAICDDCGAMKITAIDACILTVPTSRQMALEFPQHKLVVAEIATDEGLRGLGYSLVFGGNGAESVLVYLETRLSLCCWATTRSRSNACGKRCTAETVACGA